MFVCLGCVIVPHDVLISHIYKLMRSNFVSMNMTRSWDESFKRIVSTLRVLSVRYVQLTIIDRNTKNF